MPRPKRRASIGANPLDIIPTVPVPPEQKAYKARLSAHVSPDMLDELRDCVVAMSRKHYGYTIARLVQDALRAELDRLRKDENGGKAWPKRTGSVSTGRPIRS